MNAQTKRFVEMIRDANDPDVVVRAMLTACLQHVADMTDDEPVGDDEGYSPERLERLRANLEMVLADV